MRFIKVRHPGPVLASLSPQIAERTITCTSASKTFNLAGLQVSNIFIRNSSLRRRFCLNGLLLVIAAQYIGPFCHRSGL